MIPSLGRTIIVRLQAPSNGSITAPAIITAVWNNTDTRNGQAYVNVTAFPDYAAPLPISSVILYDTEAEAGNSGNVGWWPARV